MIQSMTGYGKGIAELAAGKLVVEIRSVNGKNADISIKSSLLPKEKEIEVRKRLAERLQRGTIDLFLNWEPNETESAKQINGALVAQYYKSISSAAAAIGADAASMVADNASAAILLSSILKLPDVVDSSRRDIITEENWDTVSRAIDDALDAIVDYRSKEGEALYRDVTGRVNNILDLYLEIEKNEPARIQAIRDKINKSALELQVKLDPERLEQEMIFYIEKLDINEEKVRLRQHCKYFMDTIDGEPYPGKKLGFIIQEMGREINTTGSKANDASIQQYVVRMKDELEKMREQSMNIL